VKGAVTERLPEMQAATPEQVAAIASAVEPRWQALILMAAYSGLRWGELAGLRQKHFDPLHKKVRVVEQVLEINGHLSFSTPKTSAGNRTVALPGFLVEHLARYAKPGPARVRHARGHTTSPGELPPARLVPGGRGGRHTSTEWTAKMRRLRRSSTVLLEESTGGLEHSRLLCSERPSNRSVLTPACDTLGAVRAN
jgi:integrase